MGRIEHGGGNGGEPAWSPPGWPPSGPAARGSTTSSRIQIGVPETPSGTPISTDSRAFGLWLHAGLAGHVGLDDARKKVAFFALLR